MKKMVGFWVTGALVAMLAGGCASKNVVKKDEAIAPPATRQTNQPIEKTVNNTPETAKMDMSKSGPQTQTQLKSALDKIYFDFDSFVLSEQARKTLTDNAVYLQNNTAANLRIEGNCDERGSAEYNIALGEKRSKAAMKYLITLGIPEVRLTTISYGKEKPADPGHDKAAWSKNRRDDFTILSK